MRVIAFEPHTPDSVWHATQNTKRHDRRNRVRLAGFDYSRPFFYMVTMKCLPNRQPLSGIIAPGRCEMNAGGGLIVLSPEGFAPRWHPTSKQEALCAKGRMLFLSLYEPTAAKLDNATLYRRCHEMGDLAVAALTPGIGAQLLGDCLATGRAEARPALAADRRLP